MTRTRVLAALLAGLTVTGLGTAAAFGSSQAGDDPVAAAPVTVVAQARTASTTTAPAGTTTSTPTVEAVTPAATAADDAAARAVTHLGGGTAGKIERETEHGRATWKVDVHRSTGVTEVYVDAASGAVIRVDGERGDDRGRGGDDRRRHGGDDRFDDHGGRHGGRHGGDDH